MFYCPTNFAFHRLFPNAGSKIITELGSLEDSPCLERDKLSNRRFHYRPFHRISNNNRQLSFGALPNQNHFASIIYNNRPGGQDVHPCGETAMPPARQTSKGKSNTMGDRSPKSNQKKSNQKQAKTSSADQKKKQAVAAKQAAGKKK
jgi:hypothetical protein